MHALILFGSWLATRDAPREPEGSAGGLDLERAGDGGLVHQIHRERKPFPAAAARAAMLTFRHVHSHMNCYRSDIY